MIIKLGGAAITNKQQLESLNSQVLTAAAAQLAALHAAVGPRFAVVHGAGSFGHQAAAAAGVAGGGIHQSAAVRQGFAATRASVTKLNQLVVAALVAAGVPAVGVSPCPAWTTRQRQVATDGCGGVAALLGAGLVPVLHGDAVLDEELGCTILSGDVMVTRLCQAFRPPVVAFLVRLLSLRAGCLACVGLGPGCVALHAGLGVRSVQLLVSLRSLTHSDPTTSCPVQTNVPGIFDRPPSEPEAQLIARLECSSSSEGSGSRHGNGSSRAAGNCSSSGDAATACSLPCGAIAFTADGAVVQSLLTSSAAHDTTGGVATKIREAAAVAQLGAEVRIAAAGYVAAEAAVLPGRLPAGWQGTVVRCRGGASSASA